MKSAKNKIFINKFVVGDEIRLNFQSDFLQGTHFGKEARNLRGVVTEAYARKDVILTFTESPWQYRVKWHPDTDKKQFGVYWGEEELDLSERDWRNQIVLLGLV